MRRFICASMLGLLLAGSLWLLGLLWFIALLPTQTQLPSPEKTEAVVVLTGGSGRIEWGIEWLRQGKAGRLFVSGVHPQADKSEIFEHFRRKNPAEYQRLQHLIDLGREARNTRGNALETAAWTRKRGIKKLRLVTAHYHMPRSLLEFEREMPETTIITAPVYADGFRTGHGWRNRESLLLVLSEYHKYLVIRLLAMVGR